VIWRRSPPAGARVGPDASIAESGRLPTPKLGLLETLLEGKVGDTSLEVLKASVGTLSFRSNLVDALACRAAGATGSCRSAKTGPGTSKTTLPVSRSL